MLEIIEDGVGVLDLDLVSEAPFLESHSDESVHIVETERAYVVGSVLPAPPCSPMLRLGDVVCSIAVVGAEIICRHVLSVVRVLILKTKA